MDVETASAAPQESPVQKRPAEHEQNGGTSPVPKRLKEEDAPAASPSISAGSETPASSAHTAAKSKKSNSKSIFEQCFTADGESKVPRAPKPSAPKPSPSANVTPQHKKPSSPAANKGSQGKTAKGGGALNNGLALLREQVLSVGGKESQVKGWKVISESSKPASSSVTSSPAKAPKKSGAAVVQYISPQGVTFESTQAVLNHLGLSGLSREEAFSRAQIFRQKNPCPFMIKVQQGQLTVKELGNLMVEKGPSAPTFHDESNLYPIGFKAEYLDTDLGTLFQNEVLDGMDVFSEDVPAFRVKVLGPSAATFNDKKPQGVWRQVKQHLEDNGTEKEKEGAKAWSAITLYYKFGLGTKEVRRRIEGLSGALDCFKYKFVDEASSDAGDDSKHKKAKTAKGGNSVMSPPQLQDRDDKARKKKGAESANAGAEAEDDEVSGFNNKLKRPPPQVTGYRFYSKEVIAGVKKSNPEANIQEIVKIIKKMYTELDEGKRTEYENKAAETRKKQAERRGEVDDEQKEAKEDDQKEEEEKEEKTEWRTEGSEYIGKKVRRYVFDSRNKLIDAADGVVVGWLSKEESDYFAEASGEPAPIFHMQYDDARIGREDLEEHEVVEAIDLMSQEMPEKVRAKYEKRLEIIAVQQAKKSEKEFKAKAREEAKMLKAQRDGDRDFQKKDRDKQRQESGPEIEDERKKIAAPVVDEADVLIESGKWKGIKAKNVQVPPGSQEVFPPAELSDDFISIYTFLHDLSAPLGAAKMQLDDVVGCLVSPSGQDDKGENEADGSVESFYEVAKWLTELASRGLWIHDSDEEVMDEARKRDVCDIALAPGPLLSSTDTDATVKYTCWHLLNEASWPEIARVLLTRRSEVMKEGPLMELCDALAFIEPGDLSVEQKVKLLRFLCDEAAAGDKVHRVLTEKLKQMERILEKKRVEDWALKNSKGPSKRARGKGGDVADKDAGDATKEPETATVEDGDGEGGGKLMAAGRPEGSRTCFEVMLFLSEKDPSATFEIRHKGKVTVGCIDQSGIVPRISSNGRDFDTVAQWIKEITEMKRFAAKMTILHKGQKIKDIEPTLDFGSDDNKVKGRVTKLSEVNALLSEVPDESMLSIDTDRRKREIHTALARARKGLRYDAVGYDRWQRSYWCFDGITDRVWVRSPEARPKNSPSRAADTDDTPNMDFGMDGMVPEDFKKLGSDAQTASSWTVYYKKDGTLQALANMLKSGPNGKREAALLVALREYGVLGGLAEFETEERDKDGLRAGAQKEASGSFENGDAEMKDADGRPLRRNSEPAAHKDEEEGYEWNELPGIGDLVWARLGEAHKRAWYPVLVVEPPALPVEDDAQTESDDDEPDEEWHSTGSEYLGRRVLIEVPDRRGEKQLVPGRISGWLPKEVADFKNEITQENVALWRAKLLDKKLTHQDLEEYEVKEGLVRWMRQEAEKKAESSRVLSSKSMFGQAIKKVYTRLFNEDEDVEVLSLSDLQPYLQFREQHEQEMRRAGKTKALQQVKQANIYLEQHGTSYDKEQDAALLMRQLGLSLRSQAEMPADLKAAIQHCAHFPRILNVVQDNRDAMPWITSTKELKLQLQAISNKLLATTQLHDKLNKRLTACKTKTNSDGVTTRAELVESMLELELVLHEAAVEKKSSTIDVDLDEWRTEGHEYIDKRIRRPIKGAFGRIVTYSEARIVGWLPAEESDYTNQAGEAAALWHLLWNDGAEEDLEEWEVQESLALSRDVDVDMGEGGIWASGSDRNEWISLLSNCRTVGATALALYLLGDRALSAAADLCGALLHSSNESDDHCFICLDGGKLVCCDTCHRTVHYHCVGLARAPKEKDDFVCLHCLKDSRSSKSKQKEQKDKGAAKANNAKKAGKEEEDAAPCRSSRSKVDKDTSASSSSKTRGKDKEVGAPKMTLEKLHAGLKRMGAVNGSVVEVGKEGVPMSVLMDDRRPARDERYFAYVHDGDCINKTGALPPALKGVQFYPPWRPREQKKLKLQNGHCKVVELPISFILECGSAASLFKGDPKKGFVPIEREP